MKIFITGATGFIGAQLVKRLLSDNHEVVCYVRSVKKSRKKHLSNAVFLYLFDCFHIDFE